MAEEWDLSAVVRSCQSATTTATTEIPPITTTTTNTILSLSPQNTSASLATCTSSTVKEEEYDAFSFPNDLLQPITNEFQELDQLLTPFNPTTNTTTTSGGIGINSNSLDLAGCIGRQQLEHLLPLAAHLTDPSSIWPHHLVPEASTSGITRFHDQHQSQQQNQLQLVHNKQESRVSQSSSSTALPGTLQPQTPRSRKIRKNQQNRMVCHVTADNLSADMWAWRKYGQKPIKGSPYPRNYYRCSSSKGCCARKQVERSNEEANMFIITYTGDHNHPRPTHRNSLAGSTRSRPSTPANQNQNTTAAVVVAAAPSAHSPDHQVKEEMEPESPDPDTETEVDPDGDTDWTGFNPG